MAQDTEIMELVEAFKKISTSNISDAMDKLGVRRGVIHGLKPLSMQQPRTAGVAVTIKQMQRHQEAEGAKLAKHAEVIDELSSPGDVLVFDVGGRFDICTGGALLALRAKMRGVSGYIVNGCIRDAREIIEFDFPVHCCGTSPVKSAPELETVGINIPVQIGEVQIKPGDIIVADDSGIVVVPILKANGVLKEATEIVKKEEKYAELVRAGKSIKEARQQSNL